ncbi:7866_t:CDS:2, partial [Funneliformis mosseae]
MDVNNHEDETQVDKLNKNCSCCDKPFEEFLWCKECDPCRAFTFKNLTKPINSSLITSYLEKDENNE